jgi:hypothetical protein
MPAEDTFLPWYERSPAIFEEQKAFLLSKGFVLNETRLRDSKVAEFHGRVDGADRREVTVVFPDAFPSLPPQVFDDPRAPLLQRHHDTFTRHFCLFGIDRRRWRASMGAAEALKDTAELIQQFSAGQQIPRDDDVPEPLTATLPVEADLVVMIPPDVSNYEIGDAELRGTFLLRHEKSGSLGEPAQGIVISLNTQGRTYNAAEPFRSWGMKFANLVNAPVVQVARSLAGADLRGLVEQHFKVNPPRRRGDEKWLAILFREQSGLRRGQRPAWVMVRQKFNEPPKGVGTYLFDPADRAVRVPGLQSLTTKKVMMIGCGSLGSNIAAALASTGVSQFALVDCDRYEPNNAVRHQVGVKAFGKPKPLVLATRLFELNPTVSCTSLMIQIGGANDFNDEKKLVGELSTADLIINTTGRHGVSRWLDERCFEFRVPALHASVTRGAWGGEIIRAIPGKTACWMCWGRQYHNQTPPADPTGAIYAPGCNQPSFTGTIYECGIVANFACSIAVSTLLSDEKTVPQFHGDYLRWSARSAQGEYLYRTEILPVERSEKCKLCPHFK